MAVSNCKNKEEEFLNTVAAAGHSLKNVRADADL